MLSGHHHPLSPCHHSPPPSPALLLAACDAHASQSDCACNTQAYRATPEERHAAIAYEQLEPLSTTSDSALCSAT